MGQDAGFSLQSNPFGILGATPRTPLDDLQSLAARAGTAEAAAAARALAVPRSRLPAELAFLPGCAAAASVVLGALQQGMRPDPAILTPAARANVVAHLCAAGTASEGEQDRLSRLQPASGDPALADAIDADRALAGIPPVQRAAMASEQDALADRHAAALVFASHAAADPAARLTGLVRAAPDGNPAGFMRRVAAAWARQSVADLARLDDAAALAESDAQRAPGLENAERLVAAIHAWTALTAPQRASDARAGLDHKPSLQKARSWRGIGVHLAECGRPELALLLAETLATSLADLPGEAIRLREEARYVAGLVEDKTLEARLQPLRALVQRLCATPAGVAGLANDLSAPFGPGSPGAAGELWALFDAAASVCRQSEAPWTFLRDLTARLGGEHKKSGAAYALSLHRGITARAEAAGMTDLATRLHAEDRGLERAAALWRHLEQSRLYKSRFGVFRRRRAFAAIAAALPLVDDPAERAALLAEEQQLRRGRRMAIGIYATLGALVLAVAGVRWLDQSYSDNAPYRHAAPQSLAQATSEPKMPAPDGGGLAGNALPGAGSLPQTGSPFRPLPAAVPTLAEPAAPPLAPEGDPSPVSPAKVPMLKAPEASPGSVRPSFPTRTALPERRPRDTTGVMRTLAEVRWCQFNKVRVEAAWKTGPGWQQKDDLQMLKQNWDVVCDAYPTTLGIRDQVDKEVERLRVRLEAEGRAMLTVAR